jgi:hypothetical protein
MLPTCLYSKLKTFSFSYLFVLQFFERLHDIIQFDFELAITEKHVDNFEINQSSAEELSGQVLTDADQAIWIDEVEVHSTGISVKAGLWKSDKEVLESESGWLVYYHFLNLVNGRIGKRSIAVKKEHLRLFFDLHIISNSLDCLG